MVTVGEFMVALAREVLNEGDPYLEFVEWFDANKNRLRDACSELGVEPPREGPWLFNRLRATVFPVLAADRLTPTEADAASRWICKKCNVELTLDTWQEHHCETGSAAELDIKARGVAGSSPVGGYGG